MIGYYFTQENLEKFTSKRNLDVIVLDNDSFIQSVGGVVVMDNNVSRNIQIRTAFQSSGTEITLVEHELEACDYWEQVSSVNVETIDHGYVVNINEGMDGSAYNSKIDSEYISYAKDHCVIFCTSDLGAIAKAIYNEVPSIYIVPCSQPRIINPEGYYKLELRNKIFKKIRMTYVEFRRDL